MRASWFESSKQAYLALLVQAPPARCPSKTTYLHIAKKTPFCHERCVWFLETSDYASQHAAQIPRLVWLLPVSRTPTNMLCHQILQGIQGDPIRDQRQPFQPSSPYQEGGLAPRRPSRGSAKACSWPLWAWCHWYNHGSKSPLGGETGWRWDLMGPGKLVTKIDEQGEYCGGSEDTLTYIDMVSEEILMEASGFPCPLIIHLHLLKVDCMCCTYAFSECSFKATESQELNFNAFQGSQLFGFQVIVVLSLPSWFLRSVSHESVFHCFFFLPLSCMIFQHPRKQTASGKCNDSTAAYLQGSRATPQVASIPITPQGHRFLVVRCMSDVIRCHSMWPWVELPVEIGFSFFFRTSPWRKAMRNTKSETFSWDSSGNLRWIWTEVGTWPSWAPTKTTLWSIAKLWMTCRPWRWTKATAAWF